MSQPNVPAKKVKPISIGKTDTPTLQMTLLDALERDPQLVVLASSLATNALPAIGNPLAALAKQVATRFPSRFYGQGELLDDLVPTATRLAAQGLQPLVLMSSADLARSYAGMTALCAQHLRVIFVLAVGTLPGQTWHGLVNNDLAILRTLNGLFIGVAANTNELAAMLVEAAGVEEGPVALYYRAGRESQRAGLEAVGKLGGKRSPGLGRAAMVREGKELALLALGATTGTALALADRLSAAGHEAAVVNVRWIRPLDEALLTAVAHHFPRLVTLEEGELDGSFGAAILEMLERRELYETRLKRLKLESRLNLTRLTGEVTAFLQTLERDEGLGHLAGPAPWLPQPGRP